VKCRANIVDLERVVERQVRRPIGLRLNQFYVNLRDVLPSCTSLVYRLVFISFSFSSHIALFEVVDGKVDAGVRLEVVPEHG
jgi:hypothetical protein